MRENHLVKIQAYNPIDAWYPLYQRYYLEGFRAKGIAMRGRPFPLRGSLLCGRLAAKIPVMKWMNIGALDAFSRGAWSRHHSHVGQYLIEEAGQSWKVAIDAHDKQTIQSPEILDWCDVYFKCNKKRQEAYEPKVRPLVNGNGFLDLKKIETLRALRSTEPVYDLVYISRLWGDSIEHATRIFEQVARFPGKKKLLAVFPEPQPEHPIFQKRLEAAGVEWTHRLFPMSELWRLTAQSRIMLIRQGKHLAVPWRVMDLLAMGTAIVFDREPVSDWAVPLREGVHFRSLDIEKLEGRVDGPAEDYEEIVPKLERYLQEEGENRAFRERTAHYFDEFGHPERVADYLLREIQK